MAKTESTQDDTAPESASPEADTESESAPVAEEAETAEVGSADADRDTAQDDAGGAGDGHDPEAAGEDHRPAETDVASEASGDDRGAAEDRGPGPEAAEGAVRDGDFTTPEPEPPTVGAPQMVPPGGGGETEAKGGRRAHLTLSRIEPWSVMKFSFVMSLVCFIILFVAVAVIYAILSSLGVFDAVSDLIDSLTDDGEDGELGLNPSAWFAPARVLGYTGLIGALNIILITALSTVGAMLYNLAADLVGGLDVTLSESE